MLRRLSLLLLLLVPAPLAAQFTPFTAPGGELFYQILYTGGAATGGARIPMAGELQLYLLDSTGTRVRQFWNEHSPWHGSVGVFAPGEVFGLEVYGTGLGYGNSNPLVLGGSLVPNLTLDARVGPLPNAYVDVALNIGATPEPVSLLLLGSGLIGVGAVARRRRNAGVA